MPTSRTGSEQVRLPEILPVPDRLRGRRERLAAGPAGLTREAEQHANYINVTTTGLWSSGVQGWEALAKTPVGAGFFASRLA